jgi:glycosyltransferase involved in cell wall biosynthesis
MPDRVLTMISSMRGGGSEQQTLLLLRHLDRSKFTPHLYLLERTGELMSRVPEDVVVHSFEDAASSGGFYFPGRVLRQQVRHLQGLLQRESIDVIYDRTFHMSMIAGPAGKACGVPRVSTIVSPPEHALPLVESRFVGLKRRRLADAYQQSRSVIAVSQQAATSAKEYYDLPSDRIHVIHNPVDIAAVQKAASEQAYPRDDRLTLVCVGRMTEEKGHRDLISAVISTQSRWPDGLSPLKLSMIGDGPLRKELELQWLDHAGPHKLEFLGTQQNPLPYVAAADALVLPSHFEGMPNVVLEAMALGTPVIATRAGGTVELEREKPTVLWAQPGDPGSLADAILQFATDRESAKQRALMATELIHEHHDVRRTTRLIEELLSCRA